MIFAILVISIILIFAGIKLSDEIAEVFGVFVAVINALIAMGAFIVFICLCVDVSELRVLDQQLQMYEEENTRIEEQISEVVTQYREYEKEIFVEMTPESAVTLVTLYPELKSDALVQKQLEIYIENNERIKDLKEQKIKGIVLRWWLYFGR